MHHGKSGLHCAKAYYGVIPKPYDPLYIYIYIYNDSAFLFITQVSKKTSLLIALFGGCSLVVQVLCSYSTLPLYALVSQVGELIHPRFTLHELLYD
jgi:hypothetical protein